MDKNQATTIRWPKGSKIPVIRNQAKLLNDGRIEATYTPEEFQLCMNIFNLAILPLWPECKSQSRGRS